MFAYLTQAYSYSFDHPLLRDTGTECSLEGGECNNLEICDISDG